MPTELQRSFHVSGNSLIATSESDESVDDDPRGLVLIWEEPKPWAKYILGLDPSEGITNWSRGSRQEGDHKTDNGVIEVFRPNAIKLPLFKDGKPMIDKLTNQQMFVMRDLQVAEFAAPIDAVEIARVANILGRMYAGEEKDQAELILESYPGPGPLTTQELIRLGYGRLWMWEHFADSVVEETNAIGWHATPRSTRILWTRARRHLMERKAKIFSKWLYEEYANAVVNMDKMTAAACFIPGTRIVTDEGWKEIQDFKVGSRAINRSGGSGEVCAVIENYFSGNLVGIHPRGTPDTQYCTPDHLIWTKPGPGKIYNRKEEWVKAGDLKDKDCVFVPKRKGLIPTAFSPDQLWVMGFWLAEGNVNRRSGDRDPSVLIFNNSNPKLLKKALRILKEWFPRNIGPPRKTDGYIHDKPSGGSIQFRAPRKYTNHPQIRSRKAGGYLSFGNYQAASLFISLLGEHAENKCLSPYLMQSSGLLPLVAGYFDGDGTQRTSQEKDVAIYGSSWVLCRQIRRILLDHDVWCTLQILKRKAEPLFASPFDCYVLNIKANEATPIAGHSERMVENKVNQVWRIQKTPNGYWVPVSISEKKYSGSVFDLSIDGEHSYITECFAVHNCYGRHDDRLRAANLCFWAGHAWTQNVESTHEQVTERPISDWQHNAPTLGENRSYRETWAEAVDNWSDD